MNYFLRLRIICTQICTEPINDKHVTLLAAYKSILYKFHCEEANNQGSHIHLKSFFQCLCTCGWQKHFQNLCPMGKSSNLQIYKTYTPTKHKWVNEGLWWQMQYISGKIRWLCFFYSALELSPGFPRSLSLTFD